MQIRYPIHEKLLIHITQDSQDAISHYIIRNKNLLFHNTSTFLKRNRTNLARSLFITEKGEVSILLNRKTREDKLIGRGSFKIVTLTIDPVDGEYSVSASQITDTTSKKEKANEEMDALKMVADIPGTLKCKGYISYTSSKRGYEKMRSFFPLYNEGELNKNIKENRLSLEDKKRVFEDLIRCVADMHRRGLIHRDIKPENVLLHRDKERKIHPILADLGFTTYKDDLPKLRSMQGSPAFFSPDYLRSLATTGFRNPKITTFADDMWSLGLTLYALLTDDLTLPLFDGYFHIENQKIYNPMAFRRYADDISRKFLAFQENNSLSTPLDLVECMLQTDPSKRISAEEAESCLNLVFIYTQND